uniref:CUB domain-containing protein n=1 Tax=Chrysemys picta bellii TaxID=8478 RepID=A0A8C3H5C7_CHRPI
HWNVILFVHALRCRMVSSSPTPRKLFGEITSPNYPKPYPNNNISSWDITVPKGFVVKLNFWQFDLQPSESCLSDYVKITADKKDLGQYCGELGSATGNHPGVRDFVSKGNWMRLMFHSDFSNEDNGTLIPYKGFLAYYQAVGEYESTTPCRRGAQGCSSPGECRGALGPTPNRQRPQDSSQTRSTAAPPVQSFQSGLTLSSLCPAPPLPSDLDDCAHGNALEDRVTRQQV